MDTKFASTSSSSSARYATARNHRSLLPSSTLPAIWRSQTASRWRPCLQAAAFSSRSSSSSSGSRFLPHTAVKPSGLQRSVLQCRAAASGNPKPTSSSSSGSAGQASKRGFTTPEDPWAASANGSGKPPTPGANGNGTAAGKAAAGPGGNGARPNGRPRHDKTDWGWDAAADEDWDPSEGLTDKQLADLAAEYAANQRQQRAMEDPPRDKWITPLLDWKQITGAFDPDQTRTEEGMAAEALTNKEESRAAVGFAGRLVVVPLIVGALLGRAIAQPVLGFVLQNNPNAFAMTERQKIEGAQAVHMEETRVRMLVAIGQAPPLTDDGMLQHLREYALEYQDEEREKNERNLMTLVSDSISAMVLFTMVVRDSSGRTALFNTLGRLFEGLSDIAKAVMIILVADTLLGYHSEEGWTGLLDLVLGHYGAEVEEEDIVLFVGIIPIAIDVLFKYWVFIGLNKISPGAVVTIKQIDRH